MFQYLAYLDPGTGSLFFQAIVGGILAGSVMFRSFFTRIVDRLKLAFSRVDE